MKNLRKFYNKEDLPWVHLLWDNYYTNGRLPSQQKKGSFWRRDIVKLQTQYKGIAKVQVGNGTTVLLWEDLWGNVVPQYQFSHLHSYAKNKAMTLCQASQQQGLYNIFNLPISEEAYEQFIVLRDMIQNTVLPTNSDIWKQNGDKPSYSSSKAYKSLIGHIQVHPINTWLWASKCQPKH